MKVFKGLLWALAFSAIFWIAAGIIAAGLAKADPATKPMTVVAEHICTELDANPTVAQLNMIVDALFAAGNTTQQENDVMFWAMHVTCPEYKYLAVEAARQAIDEATPARTDPMPEHETTPQPWHPPTTDGTPFNGKRLI